MIIKAYYYDVLNDVDYETEFCAKDNSTIEYIWKQAKLDMKTKYGMKNPKVDCWKILEVK